MSIWRLESNFCAGGNLVLQDRMSAGSLVSFMLYVTSLNGALQVDLSQTIMCGTTCLLSQP